MLGWTNAISTNFEDNCYRRFHDVRKASQFLGIHVQYAAKLFFPGSGLVEEMDRGNPWYQAHDRGLIDINSLRNSDCYNASASVAITVLEGIRDEVIFDIMFDED
jgi:hypothetical protein